MVLKKDRVNIARLKMHRIAYSYEKFICIGFLPLIRR